MSVDYDQIVRTMRPIPSIIYMEMIEAPWGSLRYSRRQPVAFFNEYLRESAEDDFPEVDVSEHTERVIGYASPCDETNSRTSVFFDISSETSVYYETGMPRYRQRKKRSIDWCRSNINISIDPLAAALRAWIVYAESTMSIWSKWVQPNVSISPYDSQLSFSIDFRKYNIDINQYSAKDIGRIGVLTYHPLGWWAVRGALDYHSTATSPLKYAYVPFEMERQWYKEADLIKVIKPMVPYFFDGTQSLAIFGQSDTP